LPWPKLVLFILFFLVGVLLVVQLHAQHAFTGSQRHSALIGLATALLIVSILELTPELAHHLAEFGHRGRFRKCFGRAAFRRRVHLVYTFRELDEGGVLKPRKGKGMAEPVGDYRHHGVYSWLAFQDVRAGVHLANTIFQVTGREVAFIHDKDTERDDLDFCAISLGLGDNSFTQYLGDYPDPSLFSVEWEKLKGEDFLTACFRLELKYPDPGDKKNLAVVARIVPRPEERRDGCVWFVCGGRSAAGTAAAGFFLAKRWQDILNIYKIAGKDLDSDSLALVIEHKEDNQQHHFDDSACVFKHEGKPVLSWSPREPGTQPSRGA
jgi:hypothetical protein